MPNIIFSLLWWSIYLMKLFTYFCLCHIIRTNLSMLKFILPLSSCLIWFYYLCFSHCSCLITCSFWIYFCLYCLCLCSCTTWKKTFCKLMIHLSRSIYFMSCMNNCFSIILYCFSSNCSFICCYSCLRTWNMIILFNSLTLVNWSR